MGKRTKIDLPVRFECEMEEPEISVSEPLLHL